MKILILSVSFLILGAWLVQRPHEEMAQTPSTQKIQNSTSVPVTSDIPNNSYFAQKTIRALKTEEMNQDVYPLTSDDKAWDDEMFEILMAYDPENGESIFSSYVMEKHRHEGEFNSSLALSLNILSDLNGQSGFSKLEPGTEVSDLEREHSYRVRTILGDHYEYLEEQRQLFRSPSEEY